MEIVRLPKNSYEVVKWNHGIGFRNERHMGMKDSNGFFHSHTGLFRWREYYISHIYQGENTWVILRKNGR